MDTFISAVIDGLGIGAVYALLTVSFVIIFRATGVLNFAQPGLLILGAFFGSWFGTSLGIPFALSVVLAMLVVAALGVGVERVAIRPMIGRPVFSAALVTVGLFTILLIVAFRLFDSTARTLNDPWRLHQLCLTQSADGCSIAIYESTVARFVIAMSVLALLGWWLTRSRTGA